MRSFNKPLIAGLIALSMISLSAQATDFRDASWGMTMAQIKSLYPGVIPANQQQTQIEYDGKLAGIQVLIFYRFDELGGLYQAGYRASTEHSDQNLYISEYNRLNTLLRRRYPESSEPQQHWTNRLFEPKPNSWGRAIALGHLVFTWSHQTQTTRISHELSSDKRWHINHVLRYEAVDEAADLDVLDQL